MSFKIAAENRARYLDRIREHHSIIAANVAANLLDRHFRPIVLGKDQHP